MTVWRMALLSALLVTLPPAGHGSQEFDSSSDGWTTSHLRNDVAAKIKAQSGTSHLAAAEQIGEAYAAAGPSKSFVTAAVPLFRSPDLLTRSAVFASLNVASDNVRRVLPLIRIA